MPKYDFSCNHCQQTMERRAPIGTETLDCPECLGVMTRQFSTAVAFVHLDRLQYVRSDFATTYQEDQQRDALAEQFAHRRVPKSFETVVHETAADYRRQGYQVVNEGRESNI